MGGLVFGVIQGSLELLNSSHVRERDKALLRSIMVGGVWNGFSLAGLGVSLFHVDSVVLPMVMVIWFGNVPSLLLLRFVKILNFLISLERLRLSGPDVCWLPMLSGVNGASPWAADASESACYMVEVALGRYSSDLLAGWVPSDEYVEVEAASSMPDHPNVWTDGASSLIRLLVSHQQVLGSLPTSQRTAGVVVGWSCGWCSSG